MTTSPINPDGILAREKIHEKLKVYLWTFPWFPTLLHQNIYIFCWYLHEHYFDFYHNFLRTSHHQLIPFLCTTRFFNQIFFFFNFQQNIPPWSSNSCFLLLFTLFLLFNNLLTLLQFFSLTICCVFWRLIFTVSSDIRCQTSQHSSLSGIKNASVASSYFVYKSKTIKWGIAFYNSFSASIKANTDFELENL